MIRSTTPTHTFTFPFDPNTCNEILITYTQFGGIVMEKKKGDLLIDSQTNSASFVLTQTETLSFKQGTVMIQVKAKNGDIVMASQIENVPVEDVLNEEVM